MPARPASISSHLHLAKNLKRDLAELLQQGFVLHQQGHLAQAKAIYEQVLAKEPRHFDALYYLGILAGQSKQPAVAVEYIDRALAINPKHAQAHYNRGLVLQELKRFEEAVASFTKTIAFSPNHADAYYCSGLALEVLTRFEEAVASYDKVIQIQPTNADGYCNRGNALQALGHLEQAVASFDQAIKIKPDYADAYYNRGNALKVLKYYERAITSYEEAIRIKPDYADAYYNRGVAFQDLKRSEEAVASFDQAIRIKPNYAGAHVNRGIALQAIERFEEALASYDEAIRIQPDNAQAYWNKSLVLLSQGNFAQGLELYEWRWKLEKGATVKRNFSQPLWLGEESLEGKTILLHSEQGLGDTLQFCRYAKLVKARGARVVLEAPATLVSLLKSLDGIDVVIEQSGALPEFDYHCPLLSLPLAFKTQLETIPGPDAYLHVDAQRLARWSARLGEKTVPRIGLAWSGNAQHKGDHNRSMHLETLLQHLPAGLEYVSMQKELRASDQAAYANSGIRFFGEEITDFADTAALCKLMDVVVSVDTSVAHLSAALGCETWILLPHIPDWRWMLDRADSPWYRSATLYRQREDRSWELVLQKVALD